tara:strand:+ start:292 stop:609 length:318 start_codon:yes stop_codon:yes gene_type:complete
MIEKKLKKTNWWDYFEFKEPKLKLNNKIKNFFSVEELVKNSIKYGLCTLLLVGAFVLLFEIYSLVNSARINLDNKNNCVKQYEKFFESQGYEKYMIRASAYKECI